MHTWPELDYSAWQSTGEALHRWLQIVGKYRLAATPWVNHSWHATFYVVPHGLTTGTVHLDGEAVEFAFDFKRHLLVGTSSARAELATMKLEPMTVAEFWSRFHAMTATLGVPMTIHGSPNEVADPVPFADDTAARPYEAALVERHHEALLHSDRVFRQFRTGFLGKVSPVHLFWGSFDLAVTRFSGQLAPSHPGGIPALPDDVTREAYSHEVSSAGLWFGGGGLDEAAFYSYAYPTPEGFAQAEVEPAEQAYFFEPLGEFVLPYRAVRDSDDPDATLMRFLQSTWEAASRLGEWPHLNLECPMGQAGIVRDVRTPSAPDAQDDGAIVIDLDEGETKGRYRLTIVGVAGQAELTYSRAGESMIIVDHTGVDDALRGRGLGAMLAQRVVDDARRQGRRIIALCPFFRSQVSRHPEWADVVRR